jgi:hypothetical protein
MRHLDFDWDLNEEGLTFDKELNTAKLGWEIGDYFKLVKFDDGTEKLVKLDVTESFLVKGFTNSIDNNKKRD